MISTALHVLTLLAMTAHAVLGCCWHHAHCQDRLATTAAEHAGSGHEVAAASPCCCGHHHATPAEQPATEADPKPAGHGHMPGDSCPQEHGGCDEGTCQYVASSSPKIPGAEAQADAPAIDEPASADFVALVFDRIRFAGHAPLDPRGGQCVRILTQTWLL
jgi:hypothetical protein